MLPKGLGGLGGLEGLEGLGGLVEIPPPGAEGGDEVGVMMERRKNKGSDPICCRGLFAVERLSKKNRRREQPKQIDVAPRSFSGLSGCTQPESSAITIADSSPPGATLALICNEQTKKWDKGKSDLRWQRESCPKNQEERSDLPRGFSSPIALVNQRGSWS